MYRPHKVTGETRGDGTILLTSGHAMSTPARVTHDWLERWAQATPGALFLAERSGDGWRAVTYAETLNRVDALAAGLLAHGLGPQTPVLILSGNGIDHGLMALAAQSVGIPIAPVAEQYSLIPGAETHLAHAMQLIRPGMVFAEDGARFGRALGLPLFENLPSVVSRNATAGQHLLDTLMHEGQSALIDARASVTPQSVTKILLTSGSTSAPKGVETTQAMMCTNQAQIADALPFVTAKPPRLTDWLPWNHVFGGSHNFNIVLANGGSMHIDAGKPVRPLVDISLENLRDVGGGTIAFNVPLGFAMLRDAMRDDPKLREMYFRDLDMLFYAGASLPRDIWDDLGMMAREIRGDLPLFTSSWGLTETAPACLIQHQPADRPGIIGVPATGTTVKLIPEDGTRFEVRVKGPNVFARYLRDPVRTAEAFDEDGFFRSGDAMRFVDPEDWSQGLRFDGRISEDFKLQSGTWVRAATLRPTMLSALAPYASDLVICGEGRAEIGLLVFPGPALRDMTTPQNGALWSEAADTALRAGLMPGNGSGSSTRVTRLLVLDAAPSMPEGEITAKGNLNFRRVLRLRADMVERLYSADPSVIRL